MGPQDRNGKPLDFVAEPRRKGMQIGSKRTVGVKRLGTELTTGQL